MRSSRRFIDDDREFVGTESGDHGAFPGNQSLEPLSNRSQRQVTDALAETVVDDLETIQVNLAQRDSGTSVPLEQRFEMDRENAAGWAARSAGHAMTGGAPAARAGARR